MSRILTTLLLAMFTIAMLANSVSSKEIIVVVTAYSPTECPNKRTASGTIPKPGLTVAASRHIPLGARIYIPSRGWHVVEDRMARRYDRERQPHIDIYMPSRAEAVKWGRKELVVRIIPGRR